jgi:hypothetical protein
MKTYSQLILELLEATATKRKPFDSVAFDAKQKAKYGSAMAKAAADALAASQKKKAAAATPSREPFPWVQSGKMVPGWWHPTKGWFTFSLDGTGYHVTQIVKHLDKFGISESELMKAAQKEAERGFWDSKTRKEMGLPPMDAKEIIRMIRKEDIDNSFPICILAYERGWLRVYGGKFHTGDWGGTLEGTDKKNIKAAIREIERVAATKNIDDIRIDVTEREITGDYFPKMAVLNSKLKRDAYLSS